LALDYNACRLINIKASRIGGRSEAIAIHDLCEENGVPVWCGGMLESGIGRLHNIAMASLPNFQMPGDLSASSRYWHEDIIDPEVTVAADGKVDVPDTVGLGHRVREESIERLAIRSTSIKKA
jgi:O-succinylbenzoate synthase